LTTKEYCQWQIRHKKGENLAEGKWFEKMIVGTESTSVQLRYFYVYI